MHVSGHGMAERGHEDHDADERVAHIYSPLGANLREVPYCVAGDICALTKSAPRRPATPCPAPDEPLLMAPWDDAGAAAAGRGRGQDPQRRGRAGPQPGRLVAGDPTLRLERNAETHQLVLWCMGEAHADVVLARLRAGGADVDTEPVKVALRETFAGPGARATAGTSSSPAGTASTPCATSRSSRCRVGAGFEFVDKVVGGAVPHKFIPSVEKGVRAQMEKGLQAGYPVVDIRVTLVDGKAHSVDSSDAAFQTAGCAGAQGRRREGPDLAAGAGRRGPGPAAGRAPRHGAWRPVQPARPGARHRGGRRPGYSIVRAEVPATAAAPLRDRPALDDLGLGHVHPRASPGTTRCRRHSPSKQVTATSAGRSEPGRPTRRRAGQGATRRAAPGRRSSSVAAQFLGAPPAMLVVLTTSSGLKPEVSTVLSPPVPAGLRCASSAGSARPTGRRHAPCRRGRTTPRRRRCGRRS